MLLLSHASHIVPCWVVDTNRIDPSPPPHEQKPSLVLIPGVAEGAAAEGDGPAAIEGGAKVEAIEGAGAEAEEEPKCVYMILRVM